MRNAKGHIPRTPAEQGSLETNVDSEQNARMRTLAESAAFWNEHDRGLEQHGEGDNVTLSHDLYRGMPSWFNAYFGHFQRRALLQLIPKIGLARGMRGLDLGCGTGRWTSLLLRMGLQSYGFDLGRGALEYAARQWRQAQFSCGQLPFLSFADDSFDLAISVTVLQHIPYAQQDASVQSIARVLRSGGYLLACETIVKEDPAPHIFGNSMETWLAMFRQAGFQLEGQSACEYLPHVKLFHWGRRLLGKTARDGQRVDVSSIARLLARHPLLAIWVRLAILISYPLEYLASSMLPMSSARLICFLLRKRPCASV